MRQLILLPIFIFFFALNNLFAQFPVNTTAVKYWTGDVSTDWNDPGNWYPFGVPTRTESALIQDTLNHPVISTGSPAATAGHILIVGDATLTIGTTGKLEMDFLNVGTDLVTIEVGNLPAIYNYGIIEN